MILDPGLNLTLRPMKYPDFFEMYKSAIKNTWTVEEIDFSGDVADLNTKMTPAERHLINRLVAFFATGDTIVSNNLVLNLYRHVNSPEARLYLSRQLFEEAVHVDFYLTLLDSYIPDPAERNQAFAAIDNIPSIRQKAAFCFEWMDSINKLEKIQNTADMKTFLLNLICFATCIEGLFFFAAFAYVYFLRSKGLLNGLAAGTNWVFRDESAHIAFAMEVIKIVRKEAPMLFDQELEAKVHEMMRQAPGRAEPRRRRPFGQGHAPLPRVRGRHAPGPAGDAAAVRFQEPLRLHGAPGRPRAGQLLRAPRLRLPDRRDRGRQLHRAVLRFYPRTAYY
jgi:ribonucleoside-diphosphate reductase beta chain